MKIINKRDLESKRWHFSRGEATSKIIIETPDMLVSTSVIAPNSRLPDKPHEHPRHEMLYVQAGNLKIHVGQETQDARVGDFVIFEPYEAHTLTTGEDEVVLFEVFWK